MQSYFEEHFNQFVGRKFEKLLLLLTRNGLFGHYDIVNPQWGKIHCKELSENQYEIDVLAWNKKKQKILLIECRWSDLSKKDTQRIVKKLDNLKTIISPITKVEKIELKIVVKSFLFQISESDKERLIDINALDKLLQEVR